MTIKFGNQRAIISDVAITREGTTVDFESDVTVRYIFLPTGKEPTLRPYGNALDNVIAIGISGCETGEEFADTVVVDVPGRGKVRVLTTVKRMPGLTEGSFFRIHCTAHYA
ncbi:hypothetical protein RN629_01050 [Sphingomonadaceae bacterium jetA1]|jgi:hypothetical protein|uniref:hypothetical protein n=1 Tax=Facivitalis istanbulensis TaxID=3075838 RepID=UPI003496874C